MTDSQSGKEAKSDKKQERLIDDMLMYATGSLYPQAHVVAGTNIPSGFVEPEKAVQNYFKFRDEFEKKGIEPEQLKQLEKAYIEHLTWRWNYVEKVFNQQKTNGWIIMTLLVSLIIGGLIFTAFQVYTVYTLGDWSSLTADLQIETVGKISISSTIVGAIVLVISLAFFYLYLLYVYKIQNPEPPHIKLSLEAITELAKLKRESG